MGLAVFKNEKGSEMGSFARRSASRAFLSVIALSLWGFEIDDPKVGEASISFATKSGLSSHRLTIFLEDQAGRLKCDRMLGIGTDGYNYC